MEILYVITIAAICVLCVALLFTARRILRSSPLSSGELALAGAYDGAVNLESDTKSNRASDSYDDVVRERLVSVVGRRTVREHVDSDAVMATWVPAPAAFELSQPEIEAEMEAERLESATPELDIFVTEAAAAEANVTETAEVKTTVAETAVAETFIPFSAMSEPAWTSAPTEPESVAVESMLLAETPEMPVKEKPARVRKPLNPAYSHGLECLLLGVSVLVLVASQRHASRGKSHESSSHRVA